MIEPLFLIIMNYDINIWGTINATQIQRRQRQNFSTKVPLGGAAKYDHVTPYLKELEWLKISQKHYFVQVPQFIK